MVRQPALVLATAGLALGCVSCSNRPIEQNFTRRCENLRRTTGWLIDAEQRRPASLEKTARVIEDQNRHDAQRAFVDNPATMELWFNEEFARCRKRAPACLKAVGDELSGDLGSIEQTVPKIID